MERMFGDFAGEKLRIASARKRAIKKIKIEIIFRHEIGQLVERIVSLLNFLRTFQTILRKVRMGYSVLSAINLWLPHVVCKWSGHGQTQDDMEAWRSD